MKWKRPTDKREHDQAGAAGARGPAGQPESAGNVEWEDPVEGGEGGDAAPVTPTGNDGAAADKHDRIRQIEAERDEAIAGRLRALADFKNYQRRAVENEAKAVTSGATSVVKALLPVLDHFEVALAHDRSSMTVEHLDQAMGMVHDELLKALEAQGVERIEPQPGDEFDPMRHTAVTHMQSDDIGPGLVGALFQSGYALGDYVLRPAKVAVTPSE